MKVPGAVMQETGAPQISALKLIQVSNVSELQKAESWGWAVVEGKELDMYIYIYTLYIYSLDIFGSFSLFGLLVKACQTFSLGWTPQNYLQRLLVYEEFGSTWAVNNAMASWLARQ